MTVAGSVVYQPSVSISLLSADQVQQNSPQRVLLVGQKTASGSAASGAWVRDIGNSNEEIGLFGRDSMLAEMVRTFKKYAPQVSLDAIALADAGGGVAKVATIGITGTATAAGTLIFRVASDRRKFTLAVANGEASATTLANAATLLNADPELPFDVTVVSTNLTFTAINKGTVANDLGIEVEGTVSGLTIGAVTISGGSAVAGSVDPTLTTVLDVVGTTRYQGIVWPYPDAVAPVVSFLNSRWNVSDQVMDGVAFTGKADTYANLLTLLATSDYNAIPLVAILDELQAETGYKGPACHEPSYVKATAAAAIRALRLTKDAPITRFLTTTAPRDQFGGPHLASLPLYNTLLPDLSVPRAGRGFTRDEIEAIKAAGGTIFGQNIAGSALVMGEVVTTYLTNPSGANDVTWHYLELVDTMSTAREYFQSNMRAIYAQSRLTEGAPIADHDQANADTIRGSMKKLYNDLSGPGFVLLQSGEAAIKFFDDNMSVTLTMSQGKVDIFCKALVVVQARTFVIAMKVAFSTAG